MLLIGLLACNPDPYTYGGFSIPDYFPLDGQRTWSFHNESQPYGLKVELADDTTMDGDMTVHTLEFYREDTFDLLMEQKWASEDSDGVFLYGVTTYAQDSGDTADSGDTGGMGTPTTLSYDPPVQLGDEDMVAGDTVTTETGGATWTSTFESTELCPNEWVGEPDPWECLRFNLDDGDGDPAAGSPAGGKYWIIERYTLSWFQIGADTTPWILVKAEWES